MMATRNLSKFYEWGRKIIGVGMNYEGTLRQFSQPKPLEPVLFLKPPSSYITSGQKTLIPQPSQEEGLWYEAELGVVIGKKGARLQPAEALDYVGGYCAALDMTCSKRFSLARQHGNSWDIAKGFDTATAVGNFIPKEQVQDPHDLRIWVKLNETLETVDSTREMLFKLPELISFASHCFTLEPGDLILSGAPEHGDSFHGDMLEAGIGELSTLKTKLENV